MNPKTLVTVMIVGIALMAGILVALKAFNVAPAEPAAATILPLKTAVPAFSAFDQNGDAINQEIFKGQWDLVFFGFTNCPDICPLTLQVLSAATTQLRDGGQTPIPRIVLVSVDPERDTPAKISDYIDNFGDENLGITGDLEEIKALASGLFVFFEKQAGDGDYYAVDHAANVLVIDPDGRLHAIFSTPHKIENFVNDLPLVTRS